MGGQPAHAVSHGVNPAQGHGNGRRLEGLELHLGGPAMDPAIGRGIIVDPDAQLDLMRVRVPQLEKEEPLGAPVPRPAAGGRKAHAGPVRGLKGDPDPPGGAGQGLDLRWADLVKPQVQGCELERSGPVSAVHPIVAPRIAPIPAVMRNGRLIRLSFRGRCRDSRVKK